MKKELQFYFDFMSPYSYFAWLRLKDFKEKNKLEIKLKPVVLANLLNYWEIKGPGEVIPKRNFMLKTCLRYAAKNNISFTTPKTHPFNPLYVLRLATQECSAELQWKVVDCLWRAGWQERIDMASPEEIEESLAKEGLPAKELLEKTFERDVKNALKQNTKEAIDNAAFGVPTFVVDGELFWGNDSYEDLQAFLDDKDLLDRVKLKQLIDSTPRAAEQKL